MTGWWWLCVLSPHYTHHWHWLSALLSVLSSVVATVCSIGTQPSTCFGLSANFEQHLCPTICTWTCTKRPRYFAVPHILCIYIYIIHTYRSDLMTDIKRTVSSTSTTLSLPNIIPHPRPYLQCPFSANFVWFVIASCHNYWYSAYFATIMWNLCVFHTTGNDWKFDMGTLTCATDFCGFFFFFFFDTKTRLAPKRLDKHRLEWIKKEGPITLSWLGVGPLQAALTKAV